MIKEQIKQFKTNQDAFCQVLDLNLDIKPIQNNSIINDNEYQAINGNVLEINDDSFDSSSSDKKKKKKRKHKEDKKDKKREKKEKKKQKKEKKRLEKEKLEKLR